MKKILIWIILFFVSFGVWASETPLKDAYNDAKKDLTNKQELFNQSNNSLNDLEWNKALIEFNNQLNNSSDIFWENSLIKDELKSKELINIEKSIDKTNTENEDNLNKLQNSTKKLNNIKEAYDSSKEAESDLSSRWFMVDTWKFTLWNWTKWSNAKETINKTLWTLIQKLMIALWTISLFIMTIWAWYMIMYVWQDELLSKWKSIFSAWIISLVVALSSYYLISIVRFILYS